MNKIAPPDWSSQEEPAAPWPGYSCNPNGTSEPIMITIIIVSSPHHWYQKGLDPGVDLDLINPSTWPIYQKEIVSKLIQDRQVIYIKTNK